LTLRRAAYKLGARLPSLEGSAVMDQSTELTLEELRARIKAAGITIADHRLAMVRKLLSDALVPVRALDSRAIKTVEPAVKFTPADEAGR
jgi:hypothetical protein